MAQVDEALSDPVRLVEAAYALISGPAGAPRDWARWRGLYLPDARMLRTVVDPRGRPRAMRFGLDEYIADVAPRFAASGFHEVQVGWHAERFGAVMSARSVYEARRDPADRELLKRGVNFIHLYDDGTRWWIASVVWDDARPGVAEPDWFRGATPGTAGSSLS